MGHNRAALPKLKGSDMPPEMRTVTVKRYLHGDTDELSDLWPADAPQQEAYANALYEVWIDLQVDLDTGKSRIVAVDGHAFVNDHPFA